MTKLTIRQFSEEMKRVISMSVAAWNRGDLKAVCSFYSVNAKFQPEETEPIIGREAILQFYEEYFEGRKMGKLKVSIKSLSYHSKTVDQSVRQAVAILHCATLDKAGATVHEERSRVTFKATRYGMRVTEDISI